MRLLVQQSHVQIAPRPPLALGDVLQPRGDEHEGGVPVGERPHDPGPASYLAVEALDGVVGAYAPPVLAGEARVGQGLALGVALADPEQFLDAFPVSNHPTVKRGDIVLSAIELAR